MTQGASTEMLYRSFHVEHSNAMRAAKFSNQATDRGMLSAESATPCAKQARHHQHANTVRTNGAIVCQHFSKRAL